MQQVRKTRTGNIVWENAAARNEAVLQELKMQGYTFKLDPKNVADKFYVSRSASVVSGQIERSFKSAASLRKFLQEWNRYDRMYDSIKVVERDVIATMAAERLLAAEVA